MAECHSKLIYFLIPSKMRGIKIFISLECHEET